MKAKLTLLSLFVAVFCLASSAVAQDLLPRDNGIFNYHKAPRYRESESHPLRIVAYVLHPVGWVLREGIFRPFSALAGSSNFARSFFGFREPFDYREPLCFNDSDVVPDCHSIAPYSMIGGGVDTVAETGEPAAMVSEGSERQVFIPDVNFDFDKANLNDLGRGRVRQISQLLSSVPSLKIVVEGHTDYKGTDEYNDKLGSRRAETVMKELSELGIDPARMSTISYGESKPVFTEEEDWARAVNRRVQFSVAGENAPAAAESSSELPPAEQQSFNTENTEDVYSSAAAYGYNSRASLGSPTMTASLGDEATY